MSKRRAAALLGSLLKDAGINEGGFYAVVDALYASPLVDSSSIKLVPQDAGGYELRAKYLGPETIGRARREIRGIKTEVASAAERVYRNIFGNSSYLGRVFPSLDRNEAIGLFRTRNKHKTQPLTVTLFY